MSLRPARSADLDALLAIQARRPEIPAWTRAQFESALAGLWVGEEHQEIWGYASLTLVPPEAQLHMIAVDPKSARQGRGSALLRRAAEDAQARGCDRMTLEVSSQNAAARAFYEAEGFVVVGQRAKFYNDGSDAVLMDLRF